MNSINLSQGESSSNRLIKEIQEAYGKAIDEAIVNSGGNELIAGVMVYSAIANTYDLLKKDTRLFYASGLTSYEYEELMEKICKHMLKIFIQE